ncbi:MAG TPA: L,D-transpeptidase [Roseiarcus sp.]|nr:L,D-transpeptidase [Roseiarcus sp.]
MRFVLALLTAAAVLGWQAAARATVRIHVDLSSQTLHATSAKGGDYDWPVSTGRPGYRTPTGAYRPQRMYVMTHSSEYENAPMPHAIFFTGGYAIHGSYETSRLGQPASHGCVRLAPADAAILYEMVKREGASILITGTAPGGDAIATARVRHRGRQTVAARWRAHRRDRAATYAREISPYEEPLGAWSYYPLDGQ